MIFNVIYFLLQSYWFHALNRHKLLQNVLDKIFPHAQKGRPKSSNIPNNSNYDYLIHTDDDLVDKVRIYII